MRIEELESIDNELFRSLDEEDQRYVVGQYTSMVTYHSTSTPTGQDAASDALIDYS